MTMQPPQGQRPPANSGAAVFQKMRAIGKAVGEAEEFDRILARMKDARTGHPSIVMVGEISRGKSTLVNALLGQPGLAPVDAAETTALVVNFAPTTPDKPAGTAILEFEYEPTERPVPLQELSSWVRVDGAALQAAEFAPRLGRAAHQRKPRPDRPRPGAHGRQAAAGVRSGDGGGGTERHGTGRRDVA